MPQKGEAKVIIPNISSSEDEKSNTNQINSHFYKYGNLFIKALKSKNGVELAKFNKYGNRPSNEDLEFIQRDILPLIGTSKISFKIWSKKGAQFSVIFFLSKEKKHIRQKNITYLRENYLRTYFICNFKNLDANWKLVNGFCYSEMDDPYAPEPDV